MDQIGSPENRLSNDTVQFCGFNPYGHSVFCYHLAGNLSHIVHKDCVETFLSFLTACGDLNRRR